MSKLYLQTVQLWPTEARRQLKERHISVRRLRKLFAHVVFPWDQVYNSYRFFYKQEISEFPLFVVVFTRAHADCEAVRLLNLVYAKQLTLRIVSGRHNSAIQNPNVYADISELNRAQLLPPPCTRPPTPAPPPSSVRSPASESRRGLSSSSVADAAMATQATVGRRTRPADAKTAIETQTKSVEVDAEERYAGAARLVIEGGMTQGLVYRFLFECIDKSASGQQQQQQGCRSTVHFLSGHTTHPSVSLAIRIEASNAASGELGFPGGSAGSVGANAFISCGGIGTLHRTFGLATDRVESFRIALPPALKRVRSPSQPSLPISRQSHDATREHHSSVGPSVADGKKGGSKNVHSSRIVTASATQRPNLFWALRGGQAANFGIVLSSVSASISVSRTIVYSIVFPWSVAVQVTRLWQRTAPQRPRSYNEDLTLLSVRARLDSDNSAPLRLSEPCSALDATFGRTEGSIRDVAPFSTVQGDRNVARNVALGGIYVLRDNETEKEAERAIRRELRAFERFKGVWMIRASDYASTMKRIGDQRTYKPFSAIKVVLSRPPLGTKRVRAIVAELEQNPTIGFHAFSIDLLGGAIRDVASCATAYAAREANFLYDLVSYWDSALDTRFNTDSVERLFRLAYRPEKRDIVYVGFPINRLPNHLDAYYGQHKARLVKIKNAVDPLHVLAFPTGIVESRHTEHSTV